MKQAYLFLIFACLLTACDMLRSDDDQAIAAAEDWALAYFSCDFHEAARYGTPESERWLSFAASNITQDDLVVLAEEPLEVADGSIIAHPSDTLRTISLTVRNGLQTTALGHRPQRYAEAIYHIDVVKREGRWLVRMAYLPRSERQSRGTVSDR